MADNKDITLRIRAKDYSKQTFDSLTKTIGNLSKAMEDQRDDAKKGLASARDLENGYLDLEKATKAVIRQASDVKAFENQAKALTATRKAALDAATAESEYAAKLAAQDKVTREQSKQLTVLTNERKRSEKAVQTQTDTLQRLAGRLEAYGISVNGTGAALRTMSTTVSTANQALEAQDSAINNNAKHLADLAQAQKNVESAEMAENLRRQQDALKQLAQEQKTVANGWISTAASIRTLSGAMPSLSQQIQAILNPTEAATKTLDGIDKTVNALSASISKTRGPLKEFGTDVKTLKEAQTSVTVLAQLLDQFRNQISVVRQARTEYQNARQNVLALTAALTQNGANTQDITTKLRTAQGELKKAATNFHDVSVSARQMQQQLRQAGVDTRNLQAAEQRIIATTQQVKNTTDQLTAAYKKNGVEGRRVADKFKLFDSSGKTALSLFQRVRGEVLSLTAAYGGIYGAINLANSAVDASIVKQQTLAAVSVAVGTSQTKQAEEWNYINQVADYFGANLEELAKAYGKFSAAAAGSGMQQNETKELFENITSIGTAYGKTSDQMNLVFLSVEQMLSKGAIQAEEFKNQFGEQIPGAYEAGARALGIALDDFKKKQQAGVLDAQAVITIMRGLAKDSQSAAEQMRKGIVATQNELDNAKFRFNLALSDSGFLDAYRELLQKVTALLSGPDGKELAEALGSAFSSIAAAAQFLVENLDLVKWALANIAFVKSVEMALSLGRSFKSLGTIALSTAGLLNGAADKVLLWSARVGTATVATRVLSVAMKGLARAIPILGAILIALDIGKVLYDQSETVRSIVDGMIKYASVAFDYLKNLMSGSYQSWDQTMRDYENRAKSASTLADKVARAQENADAVAGRGGAFRRTTTDAGYDDVATNEKEFNKKLDTLRDKLAKDSISQQRRLAKDDLKEREALIRQTYAGQLAAAQKYGGETLKRTQALIEQAVENERKAYAADHSRASNGSDKQANLVSSTLTDIEQAESRAQKKTSFTDPNTSFAERESTAVKSAVDGYKDLEARIAKVAKFDKDSAAAMQERVNALKEQTTAATQQQIAIEEITRLQNKMKAAQAERANQEEFINAQFQAGLITESQKVAQLNALYDATRPKILAAVEALKEFVKLHQDTMTPEAFDALNSSLDTMKVKVENTAGAVESFYTNLVSGLLNGVGTAFDAITDSLTEVYQGTMSWGEAVQSVGVTMLQFFGNLMRDLALAIAKTMILKMLSSFAGGAGIMGSIGTAAAGMTSGSNHTGGMAGNPGGHKSSVPSSAFAGASYFHNGGVVPGLASDEVPSVLQKGEEVLTRDDPRHVLNGGGSSGPSSIRLIAVDDQRAATAEALKTPAGQQALIVSMRSQLPTIKQMLKS